MLFLIVTFCACHHAVETAQGKVPQLFLQAVSNEGVVGGDRSSWEAAGNRGREQVVV
jgi:hypothetical protein